MGPFATVHDGTIRIDAADEAAREQRLSVTGSAGHGATIVNTLTEVDGATRVDADVELHVAGPLAAFVGSGVIRDVSNRLLSDFATCLAGRLNTPAARRRAPRSPPDRRRPKSCWPRRRRSRPTPSSTAG